MWVVTDSSSLWIVIKRILKLHFHYSSSPKKVKGKDYFLGSTEWVDLSASKPFCDTHEVFVFPTFR